MTKDNDVSRMLAALRLELPEAVWKDVNERVSALDREARVSTLNWNAVQEENDRYFEANNELREERDEARNQVAALEAALREIEKGKPGRDVEVMRWMQQVARAVLAGGDVVGEKP